MTVTTQTSHVTPNVSAMAVSHLRHRGVTAHSITASLPVGFEAMTDGDEILVFGPPASRLFHKALLAARAHGRVTVISDGAPFTTHITIKE